MIAAVKRRKEYTCKEGGKSSEYVSPKNGATFASLCGSGGIQIK